MARGRPTAARITSPRFRIVVLPDSLSVSHAGNLIQTMIVVAIKISAQGTIHHLAVLPDETRESARRHHGRADASSPALVSPERLVCCCGRPTSPHPRVSPTPGLPHAPTALRTGNRVPCVPVWNRRSWVDSTVGEPTGSGVSPPPLAACPCACHSQRSSFGGRVERRIRCGSRCG